MKKEQGFSLVELLIVVAIIAIIAAIAVPSLLTARQAANESAAIEGCRTIGSAEIAYSATNNQQYGTLATLYAGNFVDSRYSATGIQVGGHIYNDDTPITDPNTGQVVGGAAPTLFGIQAIAQAGLARYDFEIGADQVVRYGPTPAPSSVAHAPLGD